MERYVLTESQYNTLVSSILSGLDASRTMDEWMCEEAVELLSDSLVILDSINKQEVNTTSTKSKEKLNEST